MRKETTRAIRPKASPRPLRQLPICTPEAFQANDFIPYGLGVTETGDQIVFNRSYGQLWRFCPGTGEIEALNPRVHLPMTPKRFFRTDHEEIDWKALDRVKAEWGIRSW